MVHQEIEEDARGKERRLQSIWNTKPLRCPCAQEVGSVRKSRAQDAETLSMAQGPLCFLCRPIKILQAWAKNLMRRLLAGAGVGSRGSRMPM